MAVAAAAAVAAGVAAAAGAAFRPGVYPLAAAVAALRAVPGR